MKHYCRVCGENDSNHLARNCSQGTRLSHGTKVSNLSSISLNGLNISNKGRLGPGLYLTTEQNARNIAKHRGSGTGTCVIHCNVNLGKVLDKGHKEDRQGSWQNNTSYDTCKSIHPRWANNSAFPEWCIKNTNKLRIVEVELIDGIIDGELNLPNVTIRIKGSCTFKGSVRAGGIVIG